MSPSSVRGIISCSRRSCLAHQLAHLNLGIAIHDALHFEGIGFHHLHLRCVEEPVRTIKGVHYHQANATTIDFNNQVIKCRDFYTHYETDYKDLYFDLQYDKLAVAVGQKSNTFGLIESREEEGNSPSGTDRQNVFFLKRESQATIDFCP